MSAIKSTDSDELAAAPSSRLKSHPKKSKSADGTQKTPGSTFAQLLSQSSHKSREESKSANSTAEQNESKRTGAEPVVEQEDVPSLQIPANDAGYLSQSPVQYFPDSAKDSPMDFAEDPKEVQTTEQLPLAIPQPNRAEDVPFTGEKMFGIHPQPEPNSEDSPEVETQETQENQNNIEVSNPHALLPQAATSEPVEENNDAVLRDAETQFGDVPNDNKSPSPIVVRSNRDSKLADSQAVESVERQTAAPQFAAAQGEQTTLALEPLSQADSIQLGQGIPEDQQPALPTTARTNQRSKVPIDALPSVPPQSVNNQNFGSFHVSLAETDEADGIGSEKLAAPKPLAATIPEKLSPADTGLPQDLNANPVQESTFHVQLAHRGESPQVSHSNLNPKIDSVQHAPSDSIMHQVGTNLVQAIEGGKAIRMRMNPPELGLLNIEITSINGSLTARLDVESAQAHRVLADNLPHLHDMLHRANTQVERIELNMRDVHSETYNPSQNSNSNSNSNFSPGNHRNEQKSQFSYNNELESVNAEDRMPEPYESKRKALPLLSGIDIHA